MLRAERLAAALNASGARYVVIGVAGANYWARSGHTVFTTKDFDYILLPLSRRTTDRCQRVTPP